MVYNSNVYLVWWASSELSAWSSFWFFKTSKAGMSERCGKGAETPALKAKRNFTIFSACTARKLDYQMAATRTQLVLLRRRYGWTVSWS